MSLHPNLYPKVVNEATHLGADLIFASRTKHVMESDVHSVLHSYYHHYIVLVKFNLNVFYPPPYVLKVCH